jgi:hypothetical protein
MLKRIGHVLRGLRYRFKHYIPRLEAEGIAIKWRALIAAAYTKHLTSCKGEESEKKQVKFVAHMDLATEMMTASVYSGEDFKIVDLGPNGPVCMYHGLKIVCDPKQEDVDLVQVLEDK